MVEGSETAGGSGGKGRSGARREWRQEVQVRTWAMVLGDSEFWSDGEIGYLEIFNLLEIVFRPSSSFRPSSCCRTSRTNTILSSVSGLRQRIGR